jgi:hypothetical protein
MQKATTHSRWHTGSQISLISGLIILLSLSILSCKKDHCSYQPEAAKADYHVFAGITFFVVDGPAIIAPTVSCTPEIVEEPIHGVVELVDSSGVNYTAESGYSGKDHFVYRNDRCREISVSLQAWADLNQYCLDAMEKLPACQRVRHTILPSVWLTEGFPVVASECRAMIAQLEFLEQPTLGTATFEEGVLKYTYGSEKGKDKVRIKVCLDIDGISVCKERTWLFDIDKK